MTKQNKTQEIKKFWDNQAKQFKSSQLATAPDFYYRELEIKSICDYLKNKKTILDIGCGNGYSTFKFAKTFPDSKISGIDYSEEMISYAKKSLKRKKTKNLSFSAGNVLCLSSHPELKDKKFDYIVSERCLINLLNWQEQQQSLLEMKKLLNKNGKIILCENTQEGLARLNRLRKKLGLSAISVRWHNYYMPEKKLLDFSAKHFKVSEVKNIGSMYYIISRVVYAKLCDLKKEKPDYLNPINNIAAQLPVLGDFSPNFIFVLENKYKL